MHRVLERQIAKARRASADGSINVETLLKLVDASYEEADRERRLAARSVEVMEQEMRALHEQVRRQGEALLKGVLEAVGDGVILADRQGKIVDINAAVERLFGYGREELLGADLSLLMAGDDAVGHPEWIAAYNHSGQARVVGRTREMMARRKDGMLAPIELAVGDLSRFGVRQFVGIVRDITERLRIQREIEEGRRRFRDFAEASSDWMWETDARHRLCNFIGNFNQPGGLDPDQVIGRTRLELMAGLAPPELIEQHRADLAARRPFREFTYPVLQNGALHHVRISGRPIFNGDGAFVGYRGTSSDVTERLAAEERLATLERQLSTAISSMSEGFVLYDCDERIVACNDRYRSYYADVGDVLDRGASLETMLRAGVARGYYDLGDAGADEWVAWRLARHRAGDELPTLLRLADGRILRVRERRIPGGGVVGVHSDVTEELALQQQLREAKDAAETGSRAKSEFLAVMSHEIRTPMNGVIGMTGLLLSTSLDDEQKHFAATIRDSAESLLAIINDILDYSKVEAGRMDFESADFDVVTLVESVVEILAPRALGKGVEIASHIEPAARLLAKGDAGRVRQILMNLAGNAVKFTDHGWVSIEVSAHGPATPRPDGENGESVLRLRFSVSDTGVGIEKSAQERLFGMFMQADGSATRRHGGTGLGLAISRRLAELMGGGVGFSSEYGKGSTFWFDIPLLARGPSSGGAVDLTGARLLVVDDLEVNRDFLRQRLGFAGAEVETADSAAAALDLLAAAARDGRRFDVAILDEAMPGGSGLHLATAIRGDSRWAALPLVLASSRGVLQLDGEHHGLDAVVQKPLRDTVLFTTLARLLRRCAPAPVPAATAPDAVGSAATVGRVLRLLVVEDNAVNQQVALGLLRRLGHTADVAGDGVEALEAVRQRPYDLIFMDVRMPRMDGLEATRRIRQLPGPAARTPIVAMTANAMRGDEEECLDAGMDGFLPKPVERERLYRLLAEYGRRAANPCAPCAPRTPCTPCAPAAPAVAASPGPAVPDLDAEVLEDLLDVLGGEDVAAIVQRFFSDAPDRLRSLVSSHGAGDLETATREAHSLKGGSGSLGLRRVEAAALALEKALRFNRQPLDCPAEAAALADLVAAARGATDVWLAENAAG